MIASKDSTDWVIATASRCGSSHLRTALTQEAKSRPENPVADFLNPWQGGKKEDVAEYDLRIFLAREPLERWNSLFYYFRNVREQPPLEDHLDTFPNFMDGIVARNWTHYDCTPLTDHLQDFEPHRVLLLQDFDLLWDWIDAPYFWKDYYYNRSSTHSNPEKRTLTETLDQYGPLSDEAESLIDRERTLLEEHGAYDHPDPSDTVVTPETTDEQGFEVRSIPPSELSPHPENYRRHPPEQIEEIKASIRRIGIYKNVVAARDLTILAGHGVCMAADEMDEIDRIPVVVVDVPPQSTVAKQILTGDNKLSALAQDDEHQLADLLTEIHRDDTDEGLAGTGYDEERFGDLLTDLGRDDPTTPDGEDDLSDKYENKIQTPTYEPTKEDPPPAEALYDPSTTNALLKDIEDADLPDRVEQFLRFAAYRHTEFYFDEIAEYYAHAPPHIQELIEASALVIIDFDQAIEEGFVQMSKRIQQILRQH